MPSVVVNGSHSFAYNGKASLLELLERQQSAFLDLLEEAARRGWITGDRFQDLDQAITHLVVKHDIPQEP